MAENQTIKERLISFIAYLGIGQGKFEKECGLANGYVNNIRKSITPEKLQIIALHYPDLNTGWLMTGEGEMLKSGAVVGGNGIAVSGNNVKTGSVSVVGGEAAALREKVKMMQALLEEKDKLLEEKERNIADKERMIKILMER